MESEERMRLRLMYRHARAWLAGIFVALIGVQTWIFFSMPNRNNTGVYVSLLCGTLWMTALLVGVWRRHTWARGFLVLLLLAGSIACLAYPIWLARIQAIDIHTAVVFFAAVAVQLGAIWVVSSSRSVKALMRC